MAKYWGKNKVRLAVYGIENQSRIDRNLPLRIIGYDGASYKDMYLRAEKEKIKPFPTITLVLYFGTERWNKNRKLSDIIDIPDGLSDYFNDYKINVVEVAWLEEDVIKRFRSDFRIVADYFVGKRKNPEYIPESKDAIHHVDAFLKFMSAVTGDERYVIISKQKDTEEVHTMCEVLDRVEARGEARGISIGEARGIIIGEEKISKLNCILIKEGKIAELEKASKDSEYRKSLYILYGIE